MIFKSKNELAANDFICIKDIRNNFLYTDDNNVLIYIKIYAKNIKLLSYKEQESLTNLMTAELSNERENFKIYVNNRNVDVSKNIENTVNILENIIDIKKKDILKRYIKDMYDISAHGKANEVEICFILCSQYKDSVETDLFKKANDYVLKFNNLGYKAEILSEKAIIQLCNIFLNESYAYKEDTEYTYTPPSINKFF